MRSAIAFLPPCMITFMNLASSTLPYLGSGRISRLGTSRRRGISLSFLASAGPLGTRKANRPSAYSTQDGSLRFHRLPSDEAPTNENWLSLLRALGAVLGAGLLA